MSKPQILMCPPDHYGIEYEINPWMNKERQADHELAVLQWTALWELLQSLGAQVSLVDPVKGLPDLVFTANAALIYRRQAVLSRFHHEQRQGEEPYFAARLESLGFEVLQLEAGMHFEGAGDALFCGDTLFAGYLLRSDAAGQQQVAEMVGHRVIPMELVDPYYYHLDTCFCPLDPETAIYYPAAFDDYGRSVMAEQIPRLIEVVEGEARTFACNAVVVANNVITNSGCPLLHRELEAHGFQPRETPLSEFVKAGGSAKCLTLRLDGEEAAEWRAAPDREA